MVFDLDDTLLRDDLSISGFTVSVFRALHRKDFAVVAASGRAQLSMKPYVEMLGCVDVYISCNGAELWDGKSHTLLHQVLFPTETVLDIARFAEKHHCYAQVYEGDRFCFNRHGIYAERYAASARLTGCYVGRLSDYIHDPRNKILIIDEPARISALYAEASVLFAGRASVTCSKPQYLEFNPLSATKGNALKAAASYLKIPMESFIAFGDSLNDLSMLQSAGMSVVVSNGWEEIRKICHHVCGSNNHDGPAHFLCDRYLNGEVLS